MSFAKRAVVSSAPVRVQVPVSYTHLDVYKRQEYLLPELIDQLIHSGEAAVDVLETKDEWFGVTYQEDKASVQAAFKKLTDEGVYPEGLYH